MRQINSLTLQHVVKVWIVASSWLFFHSFIWLRTCYPGMERLPKAPESEVQLFFVCLFVCLVVCCFTKLEYCVIITYLGLLFVPPETGLA